MMRKAKPTTDPAALVAQFHAPEHLFELHGIKPGLDLSDCTGLTPDGKEWLHGFFSPPYLLT